MRLKKEILKSPIFIIIEIISIIIIGIVLVDLITKEDEAIVEEKQEEKVIEVTPFTDLDWNKLNRNGFYTYEDDNYTSMIGIDVAAHQETIDWEKVKEAGIEFAYIRLGYRGATEGILHTDLEFEKNYKGAIENNIKVGVYWYSQPITTEEVIEEAQYVIDVLGDRHLDLPIAYDFEETEFSDGTISRIHGMSGSERTKMAVTFCNEILKNHYDVMIYTNLYWAETFYNWKELEGYPVWFAHYTTNPGYDKPFVIWQYSDAGQVDGIDRSVDMDIMFIQKSDQN